MIVMPAMDLRMGACVQPSGAGAQTGLSSRLVNALEAARNWAQLGFRRLHVVDVDAAQNVGTNTTIVEDIIRDGAVDVQAGGGVRSTEDAQRLFEAGAARIVVGSRGVEEPEWLAGLAELYPHLVVLATDLRDRRVLIHGRMRRPALDILDAVADVAGLPLGGLLVTATHVDEGMEARDLNLLEDVVEACECPVFTSGGITGPSDLRALEHRGVAGVVVGSALYTGALDPRAIALEFAE